MTKVIIREDCGNSPKNIFLQELTIAFARNNKKLLLDSVTEDIQWNIVGNRLIQGKEGFAEELNSSRNHEFEELAIHHIATHGKAGAVNGVRKLKDGRSQAFCDVYDFSNTKATAVQEITSYVIDLG